MIRLRRRKGWEEDQKQRAEVIPLFPALSGVTIPERKRIVIGENPTSFLPIAATRANPFFPGYRKTAPQAEVITWRNPWGTITQQGQPLLVKDETTLLCLHYLVEKYKDGGFWTTFSELCKIKRVKSSGNNVQVLKESLSKLSKTHLTIDSADFHFEGALVAAWGWDKRSGRIFVVLNSKLLEIYREGLGLARIDLKVWRSFKHDLSRLLYAFVLNMQTFYKGVKRFHIKLTKLCNVVNIDSSRGKLFAARAKVKRSLEELRQEGILSKYEIDAHDTVWFWQGTIRQARKQKRRIADGVREDPHPPLAKQFQKHWCKFVGIKPEDLSPKDCNVCVEASERLCRTAKKLFPVLDEKSIGQKARFVKFAIAAINRYLGDLPRKELNISLLKGDKLHDPENGYLMRYLREEEILPNYRRARNLALAPF